MGSHDLPAYIQSQVIKAKAQYARASRHPEHQPLSVLRNDCAYPIRQSKTAYQCKDVGLGNLQQVSFASFT